MLFNRMHLNMHRNFKMCQKKKFILISQKKNNQFNKINNQAFTNLKIVRVLIYIY